jgi:hypothetical protein
MAAASALRAEEAGEDRRDGRWVNAVALPFQLAVLSGRDDARQLLRRSAQEGRAVTAAHDQRWDLDGTQHIWRCRIAPHGVTDDPPAISHPGVEAALPHACPVRSTVVQTFVPRGEVTTMAQEDASAAVTGQRHAAEHADVERRHADDHVQVSQRHLAAHEELYARHGSDHTLLAGRHAAEREKAAGATLNQKAALSVRHGAQHVVMEIRHATQLAWMEARNAGERLRMDQRHAAELLAQERRHAREDRQRA